MRVSVAALSPRAIRLLSHVGEEHAAKEAGVSRPTLRIYEACPDHVKTQRCRWLLDGYYAGLARLLTENAARRKLIEEHGIDEVAAA